MSATIGVSEAVRTYVQTWGVREHPTLAKCREETGKDPRRAMQIAPEQGAFMQALVRVVRARRAVEVGVFTGYSSTAVALAMKAIHGEAAELVACDISKDFLDRARAYWRAAGVDDVVEARLGPAADSLEKLIAEGGGGTVDLMFIDADKTGYDRYYDLGLTLLRPGGLILIDNMLWSGAVADQTDSSPDTVALRALAAKIHADERVDMALATVGDGLSVVVKR
ncbi:MAG TPA: class I SAM-dependent methyltransferase [Caulobacteraceae bacterium]